jgi:hypothetical protein
MFNGLIISSKMTFHNYFNDDFDRQKGPKPLLSNLAIMPELVDHAGQSGQCQTI